MCSASHRSHRPRSQPCQPLPRRLPASFSRACRLGRTLSRLLACLALCASLACLEPARPAPITANRISGSNRPEATPASATAEPRFDRSAPNLWSSCEGTSTTARSGRPSSLAIYWTVGPNGRIYQTLGRQPTSTRSFLVRDSSGRLTFLTGRFAAGSLPTSRSFTGNRTPSRFPAPTSGGVFRLRTPSPSAFQRMPTGSPAPGWPRTATPQPPTPLAPSRAICRPKTAIPLCLNRPMPMRVCQLRPMPCQLCPPPQLASNRPSLRPTNCPAGTFPQTLTRGGRTPPTSIPPAGRSAGK